MIMQNKTTEALNDLISVARDGQDFYAEAARKVEDQELSALFRRIAEVKARIVFELGATVQTAGGAPETGGTLAGSMQQLYGTVRSTLGDKQYGYVAELEESEDRLLKAFEKVIGDKDTPSAARDAATRLLPEVRECHDVMRARKQTMKHAA